MPGFLSSPNVLLANIDILLGWLTNTWLILKVVIGFSAIIFVHELGHFLAAKWMGIRVDRFAVGFFQRLIGYRKGEGITFGRRPEYSAEQLREKGYGETDYCLNLLPFGGYVKMLGQDDVMINEETGEITTSDDPRSFTNKSVGRRMVVISAGVIFNVVFAILAYAAVFLFLGKQMVAPIVGPVDPGSPAAKAGLRPGDHVLAVNGEKTRSFDDLALAVLLADDDIHLEVERNGQHLDEPVVVPADKRSGMDRLIGIAPMFDAKLSEDSFGVVRHADVHAGDLITKVNDTPIENALEVREAFQRAHGEPITITVRPPNDDDATVAPVTYTQSARLQLEPAKPTAGDQSEELDSQHLLGFQLRSCVEHVEPGSAADEAGFQRGDVVARWGNVVNPVRSEIIESIQANENQPIAVIVERNGEPVELTVKPRRELSLSGTGRVMVGVLFIHDHATPLVARVEPETPAAALGMPRGSRILAIDGTPVDDWFEIIDRLEAAAGTSVSVRYRTAGDEVTSELAVPSNIVHELGLPPTAQIMQVAGSPTVTLDSGKTVSVATTRGLQAALARHLGQTIEIEYTPSITTPERIVREFTVTPNNIDPWPMRVQYTYEVLSLAFVKVPVSAGGNPFRALWMGIDESASVIRDVFRFISSWIESTVTQEQDGVGVQQVAGPVGIFGHAFEQAKSGFSDLLFFLAFISVNLAVINFLPLPVVDGGLMVFLILEKIRGKPVSIKVQVTTTLIGLALIIGVFLLVTLQDISRLWGGS